MEPSVFPRDPLIYDAAAMPPEQRVLTVLELVLQRPALALERLRRYGLPAVAAYDWLMECSLRTHQHFADPANRDCNKPREAWAIAAVIPARGGSKGVPRKALRQVAGKTLLQRAIAQCRRMTHLKRIIVNTDCPEIAAHARECGAEAPFLRPSELAGDSSSLEEAVLFLHYWLALVENWHYDVLAVVSAVTPGFDGRELDAALDRLVAVNAPALQAVATLPACSLDYCRLDANGCIVPFLDAPVPNPTRLAMQCGAFSLRGRRPYYQIHPWFQAHATDLPRPPAGPVPHLLPAGQCLEVDEPWDLEACLMLHDSACPVQRHVPQSSPLPGAPPGFWPAEAGDLACLLYLPDPAHCLEVEGRAAPARVLQALAGAGLGTERTGGTGQAAAPARALARGNASVLAWGVSDAASSLADALGLPYMAVDAAVLPEDAVHAGGMARPEVAAALRRVCGATLAGPMLLTDGRAALLETASIVRMLHAAAAAPEGLWCSVSSAVVHPYHLKYLADDGGLIPATPGDASSRHTLPEVLCRDGVLLYQSAAAAAGTAPVRGVRLPEAQGRVLREVADGVRALARHRRGNPS